MYPPDASGGYNKRSMFPQAYLYLMNNAHFYLDIIENRLFLTQGGKSDRLSALLGNPTEFYPIVKQI